jgi:hypothetical protein
MNYSFIYHSGIKGQKWGVRRYQFQNGTLTPEGKLRYAKIGTTVGQSGQKISSNVANIDRTISASRYAKKHKNEIAKMSNKELQDVITRKNLENQYANAMASHTLENGASIVGSMLGIAGSAATIYAVANITAKHDGFDDDYLEHHGIKGQKWGVRRYQKPDGSLTPEGMARYNRIMNAHKNDADFKLDVAKRRAKTGESAEIAAINVQRSRNIKRAVVGGTVAVAASYLAYQKLNTMYNDKNDYTVDAGELIGTRYQIGDQLDQNSRYFVNAKPNKVDNALYRSWVHNKVGNPKDAYHQIDVRANKKMKFAGGNKAREEVRKYMADDLFVALNYEDADDFLRRAPMKDEKAFSEYANRLKKQGYDGILDINDNDPNHGFGSKKPTIVFGDSTVKNATDVKKLNTNKGEEAGQSMLAMLALARRPAAIETVTDGAIVAAAATGKKFINNTIGKKAAEEAADELNKRSDKKEKRATIHRR